MTITNEVNKIKLITILPHGHTIRSLSCSPSLSELNRRNGLRVVESNLHLYCIVTPLAKDMDKL